MADKLAEVPADVARLVVAARLAIEADELTDDKELFDALEAFSSRVCYDDEGGSLPEVHAEPCTCGLALGSAS